MKFFNASHLLLKKALLLAFISLLFLNIIDTKSSNKALKGKIKLNSKSHKKQIDLNGIKIDDRVASAFDDMFKTSNWRNPTQAGTTYRGQFVNSGFNQYYGGEGYDNSEKYMAQLRKAIKDADGN